MDDKSVVEPSQYLTFSMADEECAVPVLRVREIIEYDTLTRVPSTPTWIRGVINLRGGVVPVVDLATKFGLPERPVTNRTCIVIVEIDVDEQRVLAGILADAVSRVVEIASAEIEPAPSFGTAIRVDYLLGMARSGKKFALLLDIDRVLSTGELGTAKAVGVQMADEAVAGA
jgi:chemotaxis signal transduction protein